jgi:hypothetical protein
MGIVCHIRYQIDPFKRAAFEDYARNWLTLIPRCGGDLIGFESLAAYEAYSARLRADPDSAANFALAERERFILREERSFLRRVMPA